MSERFGWNHHTHVFFLVSTFPIRIGASSVYPLCFVLVADVGIAVVLLPGAVVPQAPAVVPYFGAVVPQEPTVVPLLRSRSTVAPRPSAADLQ